MVSFDRTWRLRYRAGDEHHHKFWGQLLRWATGGGRPAGTDLVRLGTDSARYSRGERVEVRARLVQPDLSPVASAQVAVAVYRGEEQVLRRELKHLEDSPGVYAADLGEMPPGRYRAELESPQAEALLRGRGEDEEIVTRFAVDPASSPELVELAPDLDLLGRLARLSGGAVVEPYRAGEVAGALRPAAYERRERYEFVLWNSWPFLGVIMCVAAAEWLLRRRCGLP
jgi:hypothetical protein